MVRHLKIYALAASVAALMLNCQAQAAVKTIKFSGVLSTAENASSDDPDVHSDYAFAIGQKFFGTAKYDTSLPGDLYEYSTMFPLLDFQFKIGGVDLSNRFLLYGIYTDPNGGVEFLSGGADQGGSASLTVPSTLYSGSYPSTSQINGKTGFFSFADYYAYTGGFASGQAVVSAVPEPSTWASMLAGLSLAGGLAKYRRRKTKVAYA